ncbi:hypothetical protein VTO42DRAFT_152 [Malbranchea cinnamomea]
MYIVLRAENSVFSVNFPSFLVANRVDRRVTNKRRPRPPRGREKVEEGRHFSPRAGRPRRWELILAKGSEISKNSKANASYPPLELRVLTELIVTFPIRQFSPGSSYSFPRNAVERNQFSRVLGPDVVSHLLLVCSLSRDHCLWSSPCRLFHGQGSRTLGH